MQRTLLAAVGLLLSLTVWMAYSRPIGAQSGTLPPIFQTGANKIMCYQAGQVGSGALHLYEVKEVVGDWVHVDIYSGSTQALIAKDRDSWLNPTTSVLCEKMK